VTDTQQQPSAEQVAEESNAAFAAGYAAERGIEQPEAKAAEPPKEPAAEEAPVAQAPEAKNEWEGVPDKVKTEIEGIRASLAALDPVTKLPDRLRTIEGHIGGLTSLTKELKAAMAQAKTATETMGSEAPTQEQVRVAMKDPARMKQLKEDYPDWAEVFESELGAVYARIDEVAKGSAPVDASALKTEIASDVDKRIGAALQPAVKDAEARARTHAYLDFKHGIGWEERIGSNAFETWFAKQPKETQLLSASPSVQDASKLLSLYDAHLEKEAEKAKREKRLDRSVQPEGVQVAASQGDPDGSAAFAAGYAAVRGG